MEITGWITLAAVIVALGIGVASILQTHRLQERERKERLLNEIIDWAVDVTKGELLMEFADVRGIKGIQWARLYLYTTVDKLQFSFRQARTRGLYISGTVSILGADLQQAVGELLRNLEVHIQALRECMDAINSPACETTLDGATSTARKTTDSKKLLDESATKVLEEATKIKTGDIGKKEEKQMSRQSEIAFGVALAAIAINFMHMAGVEINPSVLIGTSVVIGLIGCYLIIFALPGVRR
jgi:hypothetical protein